MRAAGSDSPTDGHAPDRSPAEVNLFDLLETIDEFGEASLALIAWEFGLPEAGLAGVWSRATADGLIEHPDIAADGTEQMVRLTPRGRRHLRPGLRLNSTRA